MGRIFVAGSVGAVLMFVWGFVAHPILELNKPKPMRNGTTLTQVLKDSGAESGVYWSPSPPADMKDTESAQYKTFEAAHEAGPIALVVLHADGAPVMDPMSMLKGFLVMLASCIFAAWLTSLVKLTTLGRRLAFVCCIGIVVALHSQGSNWAWWHYPGSWTVVAMLDYIAAWAAAGVGIAVVLKTRVTVR